MPAPTSLELQATLRAAALAQVTAGKMGFKQDSQGLPIPGVLPDQFETVIKVFADGLAVTWAAWQAQQLVTGTANGVTSGPSTAPVTGVLP